MSIPVAVLERVAKALWTERLKPTGQTWDWDNKSVKEYTRDAYREDARVALTAAPYAELVEVAKATERYCVVLDEADSCRQCTLRRLRGDDACGNHTDELIEARHALDTARAALAKAGVTP